MDHNECPNLEEVQLRHKQEVINSFKSYSRDTRECYQELYETTKLNAYFEILRGEKREKLEKALERNQQFLEAIIQVVEEESCQEERDQRGEYGKGLKQTSCTNISKMRSTLKQFYREWCGESQQLKDYLMLVQKVKLYLKRGSKVLVPGSGLGRLVLELVSAGYSTQGNQVTYFMLFGSNFILNRTTSKNQYQIYPFIHSLPAYPNTDDAFRPVQIPDKVASQMFPLTEEPDPNQCDFSMAAGEFTELYSSPQMKARFSGLVTCFFLDTANNVFDYVDSICNLLADEGIWVNFGPLLYHYRQILNEVSIEISWQDLKKYIQKKGFEFLEQDLVETTYCHDPKTSYTATYRCIRFVARKQLTGQQ